MKPLRTIATRLPAHTLPSFHKDPAIKNDPLVRQSGNPIFRNKRFSPQVENLNEKTSYHSKKQE